MIGVKLRSIGDSQVMQGNAGKQFYTFRHNRKTGKVISISQSVLIQFLKVVWKQLEN